MTDDELCDELRLRGVGDELIEDFRHDLHMVAIGEAPEHIMRRINRAGGAGPTHTGRCLGRCIVRAVR